MILENVQITISSRALFARVMVKTAIVKYINVHVHVNHRSVFFHCCLFCPEVAFVCLCPVLSSASDCALACLVHVSLYCLLHFLIFPRILF